jgi:hypothetical protein
MMYLNQPVLMALVSMSLIVSSSALAGSCKESSRSATAGTASKPQAETVVKNLMTSEVVKIEIFRGDSSTPKLSKFLKPGEQGGFTESISKNGGKAEVRIQLNAESARIAPECRYIVRNTGDDEFVWKLPDGVTDVCPGTSQSGVPFKVTCDKAFNSDKFRYRTHLTLTDRQ